jgi:ribonuclease HI
MELPKTSIDRKDHEGHEENQRLDPLAQLT